MSKIFASFFFLLIPQFVLAECTCLAPVNPRDAMASSTIVMTAKIEQKERIHIPQISPDYKDLVITVTPDKYWKGKISKTMTIRVPENNEDCSIDLSVGESYLIYAHGGKVPLVTRCTRTAPINSIQAKDDMEKLGKNFKLAEDLEDPED